MPEGIGDSKEFSQFNNKKEGSLLLSGLKF
jgi:hypothetical protein